MLCEHILEAQFLGMMKMIKTYAELIQLATFDERFRYLQLGGRVGYDTFGPDRYLNQAFYLSNEWRHFRREIILRDNGCDLAVKGRDIYDRIIIHHLNPLTVEDVEFSRDCLFDPNNVVCTSHSTSNAMHFGNEDYLFQIPRDRTRGDTRLW